MASICAGPRHCVCFLCFGVYLLSFYANRQKNSVYYIADSLVLLYWLLTEDDEHGLITRTEEGTVIVYYVLAVLALLSEHIIFAGIAISLCMLSRYSLVGWVPAFLVFLILSGQVKKHSRSAPRASFCLVILFILAFWLGADT